MRWGILLNFDLPKLARHYIFYDCFIYWIKLSETGTWITIACTTQANHNWNESIFLLKNPKRSILFSSKRITSLLYRKIPNLSLPWYGRYHCKANFWPECPLYSSHDNRLSVKNNSLKFHWSSRFSTSWTERIFWQVKWHFFNNSCPVSTRLFYWANIHPCLTLPVRMKQCCRFTAYRRNCHLMKCSFAIEQHLVS